MFIFSSVDTPLAEKLSLALSSVYQSGGTDMEAGLKCGMELLRKGDPRHAKRVLFLTDGNVNNVLFLFLLKPSMESKSPLDELTKEYANEGLYVTFVGLGLDFNGELVDKITKTYGANYLSVKRFVLKENEE